MTMRPEPESDLSWIAFRYIAGELDTSEAAHFEQQLDEDQAARDAVVRAVELAGVVASIAPEFRRRRRPIFRRLILAGCTMAAAAGLLLAILPRIRPVESDRIDAKVVAQVWSSLHGADSAATSPSLVDSDPINLDHEDQGDVEPQIGRALPSWLLTAASASAEDAPREEN